MEKLYCLNCEKLITEQQDGKPFSGKGGRPAKFCSFRCRMAHYRRTNPAYRELERIRDREARRIARAKKKKLKVKK
jgi:hypothetical protein